MRELWPKYPLPASGARGSQGPPGPPGTIQNEPNVTALRARPGSFGDVVVLLDYNGDSPASQGLFQWDPANHVDDGVTRFNAGGRGSNTAGWERIYDGPIDVRYAGAALDGVTDDTAAFQRAIDVAVTLEKSVLVSGGTAIVSTLTISEPTHIVIERGGIQSNGVTATLFDIRNNTRVEGRSPAESIISPKAGGTAFALSNWPFVTEGDKFFELENLRIEGGGVHVDTTGVTQFQGGLFTVKDCVLANATSESCPLDDSVFYSFFDKTQFLFNQTVATIGQATETVFTDCFFEQAPDGGPSLTLNGSHHVRFNRCDFFGFAGNNNPDVLIVPINDGATGYDYFHDCRFGAERELSLSTFRHRITISNSNDDTLSLIRLVLRGTEFLRISGFALTSIGRDTGTATATVDTGFPAIGHQAQIGDVVHIINTTDPSFAGEQVLTGATLNTISWASAGPNVAQAFGGGLVASAGTSAIKLSNPVAGLDVDECQFDNYAYAIDDSEFIESQESRGHTGGNIWGACNRITGPLGLASQETISGGWKGFGRAYADECSPMLSAVEPARETQGLRNRIQLSEDLTGWGVIGFTNTGGQTDPLGGSTAFKIERAGVDQIVTDSGTGWGTTEGTVRGIDETDLGPTAWLQIWGKAGTTRTLWLMIIDAAGRTQWGKTVTVGDDWKLYKLPITFVTGYTSPLSLIVSCGGVNAQSGNCYVWHPAIDDFGGDYLPTPTAAYATDNAGESHIRPLIIGTGDVFWTSGSGSPEGVVTAPVGSIYQRTDGGAGTSFYVKEAGVGNVGWVGK